MVKFEGRSRRQYSAKRGFFDKIQGFGTRPPSPSSSLGTNAALSAIAETPRSRNDKPEVVVRKATRIKETNARCAELAQASAHACAKNSTRGPTRRSPRAHEAQDREARRSRRRSGKRRTRNGFEVESNRNDEHRRTPRQKERTIGSERSTGLSLPRGGLDGKHRARSAEVRNSFETSAGDASPNSTSSARCAKYSTSNFIWGHTEERSKWTHNGSKRPSKRTKKH